MLVVKGCTGVGEVSCASSVGDPYVFARDWLSTVGSIGTNKQGTVWIVDETKRVARGRCSRLTIICYVIRKFFDYPPTPSADKVGVVRATAHAVAEGRSIFVVRALIKTGCAGMCVVDVAAVCPTIILVRPAALGSGLATAAAGASVVATIVTAAIVVVVAVVPLVFLGQEFVDLILHRCEDGSRVKRARGDGAGGNWDVRRDACRWDGGIVHACGEGIFQFVPLCGHLCVEVLCLIVEAAREFSFGLREVGEAGIGEGVLVVFML